ncbi:amine dehydrogenase large subunit [Variovorax sp. J22R133]|uniref:amine dehydrogenase large subunit n=1 Tax=Variovorax brevis TaxID=3053503 RepID=UPI002574BE5C|nr:amine dehydrogenase large subunit [Variovorax sp. J22R133]MDM0111446.1 amine dehydrogenase large subunit [Variovorax sp. J22R133]
MIERTQPAMGRLRVMKQGMAALAVALSFHAQAELPTEQMGMTALPPADAQRLYVNDPTMNHIVDGRVHVIDGKQMKYLGMIGAGFAASTTLSNDRQTLFAATTYHSRLQRGTRTDVIEAWRTSDLTLDYEIEIPPKHAQGLQIKALMRQSADGRYLLVQNATPATSVTVVDVQDRKVTAEIPTPGCWGVIPWPEQPKRFSTVCGDGTLATLDLDEKGVLASRSSSPKFFDADKDPIFMHYEMVGSRAWFVSYYGQAYAIDLTGDKPGFEAPWSFIDTASAKQQWRPGGMELFAVEPKNGRLIVGMHAKGKEGSHKNPAEQLWVVDLKTHQRVSRAPGHAALSMTMTRGDKPQLMLLNALNTLLAFDATSPRGLEKPLVKSKPVGETPVYLESH